MRRFNAIFRKEMHAYFTSPTSYVAFAVYVLISSILFYMNFVMFQPSIIDFRLVSGNATFMYVFVIPLLTMRLFSDEFRQGTDELLLTSPARMTEIVLGKYAAALVLMVVLVGFTLIYPIVMSFYGTLDMKMMITSIIGMLLLTAAMAAVGLFASTLSQHQMVTAIASFVMLLTFWTMLDWAASSSGTLGEWLSPFAMNTRLDSFMKGVLNGADVLFFITLTAVFVVLSIQVLERKRWR
ncbi:ABC transporter permease subunit [Paenibacillus sp. MER TA 81-3]|uniref:ABC transporter permease subunit n=1 Tax=Paenibacillus sp. MER TA 81-3 TaxID=2939573 RepID=UPI00203EDA40|nr:ABC transporter permease subunit [Paenibacillus sp. MER TA 81-3]MCM3339057.1 ABC transporter permease subunit [Paenibacillus sp. MER TA 81-3]